MTSHGNELASLNGCFGRSGAMAARTNTAIPNGAHAPPISKIADSRDTIAPIRSRELYGACIFDRTVLGIQSLKVFQRQASCARKMLVPTKIIAASVR